MNDPTTAGCTFPDIFIFKPLYHGSERVAFAHGVPPHRCRRPRAGSNASDSTEIYAEGCASRR